MFFLLMALGVSVWIYSDYRRVKRIFDLETRLGKLEGRFENQAHCDMYVKKDGV